MLIWFKFTCLQLIFTKRILIPPPLFYHIGLVRSSFPTNVCICFCLNVVWHIRIFGTINWFGELHKICFLTPRKLNGHCKFSLSSSGQVVVVTQCTVIRRHSLQHCKVSLSSSGQVVVVTQCTVIRRHSLQHCNVIWYQSKSSCAVYDSRTAAATHIVSLCWFHLTGRYSGYATGWTVRGSYLGRGKRLFSYPKLPERLWGPPSLLSNGYRCTFLGKSGRGEKFTSHVSLLSTLRMSGLISLPRPNPFPYVFMMCTAKTLRLYL
jgi:hypothetical protein